MSNWHNENFTQGLFIGVICGILIGSIIIVVILHILLSDVKKFEESKIDDNPAADALDIIAEEQMDAISALIGMALAESSKVAIADYPLEPITQAIPDVSTNMYTYMDYRAITDVTSQQWAYQQVCDTNIYGIREIGGYFAVAMGSYYSTTIGDTFHITLKNGSEFDVFLADCKDDADTDSVHMGTAIQNYDGKDCLNVIEFVVDTDVVSNSVKKAGTFSAMDQFGGLYGDGGDIISIEYTGYVNLGGTNNSETE